VETTLDRNAMEPTVQVLRYTYLGGWKKGRSRSVHGGGKRGGKSERKEGPRTLAHLVTCPKWGEKLFPTIQKKKKGKRKERTSSFLGKRGKVEYPSARRKKDPSRGRQWGASHSSPLSKKEGSVEIYLPKYERGKKKKEKGKHGGGGKETKEPKRKALSELRKKRELNLSCLGEKGKEQKKGRETDQRFTKRRGRGMLLIPLSMFQGKKRGRLDQRGRKALLLLVLCEKGKELTITSIPSKKKKRKAYP